MLRIHAAPFSFLPSNAVDGAFDPGDVVGESRAQSSLDFFYQAVPGVVVGESRVARIGGRLLKIRLSAAPGGTGSG